MNKFKYGQAAGRIEYVEGQKKQAKKAMPWARKIVKSDNGYLGFENVFDYLAWKLK